MKWRGEIGNELLLILSVASNPILIIRSIKNKKVNVWEPYLLFVIEYAL